MYRANRVPPIPACCNNFVVSNLKLRYGRYRWYINLQLLTNSTLQGVSLLCTITCTVTLCPPAHLKRVRKIMPMFGYRGAGINPLKPGNRIEEPFKRPKSNARSEPPAAEYRVRYRW
jgi:hypothetical protein